MQSIEDVPVIVFAKGAYFAIEDILDLKPDVLGIDWTYSIGKFRSQYSPTQVIQGNLDPCTLYASNDEIIAKSHQFREFIELSLSIVRH